MKIQIQNRSIIGHEHISMYNDNDKIFRGIDRDPLELIRYVERECKAWYLVSVTILTTSQSLSNTDSLSIFLVNICLVEGSWISTSQFSGCGLVWIDISRHIQLLGTRNIRRHESDLHSKFWVMESIL